MNIPYQIRFVCPTLSHYLLKTEVASREYRVCAGPSNRIQWSRAGSLRRKRSESIVIFYCVFILDCVLWCVPSAEAACRLHFFAADLPCGRLSCQASSSAGGPSPARRISRGFLSPSARSKPQSGLLRLRKHTNMIHMLPFMCALQKTDPAIASGRLAHFRMHGRNLSLSL